MKNQQLQQIHSAQLETPLGMMLAIADEEKLLFLDFVDRLAVAHLNRKLSLGKFKSSIGTWEVEEERWGIQSSAALFQQESCSAIKLERKIKRICCHKKTIIIPGDNAILRSIEKELGRYFQGKLRHFKTPFSILGTSFQQEAWKVLAQVPYGTTQSYAEQAAVLGNPTAVRAVANANGANQLAIVIPCHRIISSHGGLGGYGSGLRRKAWLLELERKVIQGT